MNAPLAIAVAVLAPLVLQEEPLADIRSKDARERESAARALAEDSSTKATAALANAARKDDDLLVVLTAIESLDGREPSKDLKRALVDVALESPFGRARVAAARTLGSVDADIAREEFMDKAAGKRFVSAATALAEALQSADAAAERPASDVESDVKKLKREIDSKEDEERIAAAAALLAVTRGNAEARAEQIQAVILDRVQTTEDAEVVCAALDSIAAAPAAIDLAALRPLVVSAGLQATVVERRLERAIAAALVTQSAAEQSAYLAAALEEAPGASARLARIAGAHAVDGSARDATIDALLDGEDIDGRAAAAKGLVRGEGTEEQAILDALDGESEARVQLQLVLALQAHADLAGEDDAEAATPGTKALVRLLDEGASGVVREAAAVALGVEGIHESAVSALSQVALERDGTGSVTAAIALGRTRSDRALAPLKAMTEAEDWPQRAAAAEGLKQLSRPESVPPLLALLLDESSAVRATAHRALLRFSGREGTEVDPEEWPVWWESNAKRARYRTREEELELAEKYGYGVDESVIYRGLDVIVVPGRGDRIEGVLERLEIKYRIARAGTLAEAGLHPGAILLVGCTGEISRDDVDVVRWYVHAGGALFTSCWALTYTVEPGFPAVLAKYPSPGEVVDNVFAFPAAGAADSPYLRGVFDGGVRPYYSLLGAHLVEVLDPERAEILLDSPTAAARHGTGDLAAWFRAGHGVVLDTANHFEEQGFSAASGMKKPIDRQAFAVDHLGYDPAKLRDVADESWWRSTTKAAEQVSDLSVFRILTNFVREKRIRG